MVAILEETAAQKQDRLRHSKVALAACSVSTKATAQVLMGKHFYAPFTWQHDEIVAALDDDSIRKLNIIGSRGLGKSSLVALAHAGKSLLFRKKKFILYITGSVTTAIEKTENLKRQCLQNPVVREFFGSIKTVDQDCSGMDEIFTKAGWVANGETWVLPRGALQQVRGMLFNEFRPDLVIVDDLENVKACQNEDLRQELWEWFRGDVEQCVNQFDKDWKIVYIDTVKHEDCIPLKLEELPDWHTIKLPVAEEVLDEKGEVVGMRSLIPELISHEEMQEMWDSHVVAGLEDVFYRERMCKAISGHSSAFRKEHFKYYDESDNGFRNMVELLDTQSIVLIDPAKTENPRSAETAIVGVTVNLGKQSIYVREIQADMLHPEETAREAVAMANRLNAKVIGIEDAGLGAYGLYPLRNYLKTHNCTHRLIPLKAKKGTMERGKIERIRSLIPFYRLGQIYHNPACCEGLEAQLVSFPRSRRFDIMDALAYIVDALEQAEMYFFPDGADDYTLEAAEAEYTQFELEDKLEAENELVLAEKPFDFSHDPFKAYRKGRR